MARKKANIHYLYKTTCLITNRYYIGMHSTCNMEDGYMGSGKRLRYSIRKYGVENHVKEILELFESRELLIEAEKKAITPDMITDKNCMNLKEGGTGGFSIEQQRLNAIKSNEKQRFLRENDKEWVIKVYISNSKARKKEYDEGKRDKTYFFDWTGKKHSEDSKKKMSESSKGKGVGEANSQYGTCWVTKDGLNKKIKKEELDTYLNEGWFKGRQVL